MELEIRKATKLDAVALAAIRNEALALKLSHNDLAWETAPFSGEEILEYIARDNLYIASIDGAPAASVVLHWDDEHNWGATGLDAKAAYVANLAVAEAFRGVGVGKLIVDWAKQMALRSDKQYLRLDCPVANQKLCTYYEAQGFEHISTNTRGEALYQLEL